MADSPAALTHPAQALAAQWAAYLQHDRRRSAHTVRAYVATAHRFITFLGRYRGEEISAAALLNLAASDLRAFLADRRGQGLGPSSAARELSGVRAFLRYAAEQQGRHPELPRTRAPKRPRTLPRPAAPDEAIGLAENAAEAASAPWIGARDLAILLLLYGAGLRVAEALSLTAAILPLGQTLRVHRQEIENAGRSGRARNSRGDRRLCSPMSLPIVGRISTVSRRSGGRTQCGPRSPRGRSGAAEAWTSGFADSARVATQLRHSPACKGRRPARAPGAPRSRKLVIHANLHGSGRSALTRRLSSRSPTRLTSVGTRYRGRGC